jgi:hypothetical protein
MIAAGAVTLACRKFGQQCANDCVGSCPSPAASGIWTRASLNPGIALCVLVNADQVGEGGERVRERGDQPQ